MISSDRTQLCTHDFVLWIFSGTSRRIFLDTYTAHKIKYYHPYICEAPLEENILYHDQMSSPQCTSPFSILILTSPQYLTLEASLNLFPNLIMNKNTEQTASPTKATLIKQFW